MRHAKVPISVVISAVCVLAAAPSSQPSWPLAFEPLPDGSGYWSRGPGYNIVLTAAGAVIAPGGKTQPLRISLEGASTLQAPQGADPLPGYSNYLIGDNPARWRTDVPQFAKVDAGDVCPGVRLIYYGNQQRLEYDLVVHSGADPSAIRFAFHGARSLQIDVSGDLIVRTAFGEVRQARPFIYQENAGHRRMIPGRYRLLARHRVGFDIASYDHSRDLVIDPVLTQVIAYGGSGFDSVAGFAVDSAGNRYLAFTTSSVDFPTNPPPPSSVAPHNFVGVLKLDPTGNKILYSTFVGGTFPSVPKFPSGDPNPGSNFCAGLAVDGAGSAYVSGFTTTSNFPLMMPAFSLVSVASGFVFKLDPKGNLAFSTLIGNNDGGFVAVDSQGSAYVAGTDVKGTGTLPPTPGVLQPHAPVSTCPNEQGDCFDTFVLKLSPSGSSVVYATWLSGTDDDEPSAIAVDAAGNAYITGKTASLNFPTVNAFQSKLPNSACFTTPDGEQFRCHNLFVSKLNPAGTALVYSTYLGGSGANEVPGGIAVDSAGNAYIVGGSRSNDFPVTVGTSAVGAAFAVFDPSGAIKLSMNIAGSNILANNGIFPVSVLLQPSGGLYVVGNATRVTNPSTIPVQFSGTPFTIQFDASLNLVETLNYTALPSFQIAGSAVNPVTGDLVIGGNIRGQVPPPGKLVGPGGGSDLVIVTLSPSPPVPVINAIVNGATFAPGPAPQAANSFISLFGLNFGTANTNGNIFPATSFQGLSVLVNNAAIPLNVVAGTAGQINVVLPSELGATGTASVEVQTPDGISTAFQLQLTADSVGIFRITDPSKPTRHNGAVLFTNTAWKVMPLSMAKALGLPDCSTVTTASICGKPGKVGDQIEIYLTGLGKATPNGDPNGKVLPTGSLAPVDGSVLYKTVETPTVKIGGVPATVSFSGIAPGNNGQYQINVQVPPGVKTGDDVTLEVTMPDGSTDTVTIAITSS